MFERYRSQGLSVVVLIVGGVLISGISFAVLRGTNGVLGTSLVALGIACLMLGVTAAVLPSELTGSPAMKTIFGSAALAVDSSFLEIPEAQKQNARSIYLPPSSEGITYAYIHFQRGDLPAESQMSSAPLGFSEHVAGMRVVPIGANLGRMEDIQGDDLSYALKRVLVDLADLCTSVSLFEVEQELILEMFGVKLKIDARNYSRLLGSVPSSLAACVVSAVRKRPIMIVDETEGEDSTLVRLRLL